MASARVRPLSYGITPTIEADARTATFVLPRAMDVSFEANGDVLRNVHVFASPAETDVPQSGPRVMYFGPGVHQVGGDHVLRVPSDTTLYLAGGAVLEGSVEIADARNVVVRGRGVIDPSRFFTSPEQSVPTVSVYDSTDVGIRDIVLLRGQVGAISLANAARVVIAGVREINADRWSDGINIAASNDVLVDGVFLRTSDDSVAVYATRRRGNGGSRNVTVRNAALWADVAHPFFSGTHGNPDGNDVVEHLVVQNVDILEHDVYLGGDLYQGALALNAGDRVTVRDVLFDDVRIEDFSNGQVVNLKVFLNPTFNVKAGRGIERVLFRKVAYTGSGDATSSIRGHSKWQRVTRVTFEDFVRNGKVVLKPADGNIEVGPFVSAIRFRRQPPSTVLDDGSRTLRYTGNWSRQADPTAHRGFVSEPVRPGARVVFSFVGSQARVYGHTGPNNGRVTIIVDGRAPLTVDTYSPLARAQQSWFDTGVLKRGMHRVELRYAGTANVLSAGTAIRFDKLEIVQ
jgi:hypothetical protein